jgi:hypothetical protein
MKTGSILTTVAVLALVSSISRSSRACYIPFNDPWALYWVSPSCASNTFQAPGEYPAACGNDYISITSFTADGQPDPGHFHLGFKNRYFYCYNSTFDGIDYDQCGIDLSTGAFYMWTGQEGYCPDASASDPNCVPPPNQYPGPWCNEPRFLSPHDSDYGVAIGLEDGRVFDLSSIRIGYWNQYLIPAYTGSNPAPAQNVQIWWWADGGWQVVTLRAPGFYQFPSGRIHTDTIWVQNEDVNSGVPFELDDFTLVGYGL